MRTCAMCKQGLRDGSDPRPVRVTEQDLQDESVRKAKIQVTKPGLYAACQDCAEALRPVIAKRLGLKGDEFTDNHLV